MMTTKPMKKVPYKKVCKAYEETHMYGQISIERDLKSGLGDFGIQIADSGQVWICINGVAAVRFKPLNKAFHTKSKYTFVCPECKITKEIMIEDLIEVGNPYCSDCDTYMEYSREEILFIEEKEENNKEKEAS